MKSRLRIRDTSMSNDLPARRALVTMYRDFARQDATQLSELAAALQDLGNSAQNAGLMDEALSASEEAVGILRDLRRRGVEVTAGLAGALLLRARWLFITDKKTDAERTLWEAATVHREMMARCPTDRFKFLCQQLMQTAVSLRNTGDFHVSAAVCDWAIETAQRARVVEAEAVISEAGLLTLKASLLFALGESKHALRVAEESLALAAANARFDLDRSIQRQARELVEYLMASR
jgi:tetratricopeptide (TPR) repeat protein